MMTLTQFLQLLGRLWNTGNRWMRWGMAILVVWPLVMLQVALLGYNQLVPYVALAPLFGIICVFIGYLDPLVLAAVAAFENGRKLLRWIAAAIAVELIIGVYFSIINVANNRGLVALFILVVATLVFLTLGNIQPKGIRKALRLVAVLITIGFVFPSAFNAVVAKRQPIDEGVANVINGKAITAAPVAQKWQEEPFSVKAWEETATATITGPGTMHKIWASVPWVLISGPGKKEYKMPAGWSSIDGAAPEGPLYVKGGEKDAELKITRLR